MNLERLSDAQIRAKFIELGVPVGPVTGTTRKIMIKRLKALLASGAKPPTTSGEESDGGRLTPTGRRRSTVSPKSRTPRRNPPTMEPIASSTIIEQPAHQRYTAAYSHSPAYLDDSDDNQLPLRSSNGPRMGNEAFRASLRASATRSPRHSASTSYDSSDTRPSISSPTSPDSSYAAEYANSFAKKLSGRTREILGAHLSPPSLSKRLLDVKESDDEDVGPPASYSKFGQSRLSKLEASDGGGLGPRKQRSASDPWYLLDSPVSALLLVGFLLFFASIGVVYVNKTSPDSTSLTRGRSVDVHLCGGHPDLIPDVSCVRDEDIVNVELMTDYVLEELARRLSEAPCAADAVKLTDGDMFSLIAKSDAPFSYLSVERNIQNLRTIFEMNPQWNIKLTKGGIELAHQSPSWYCQALAYITVAADWIVRISLVVLGLLGAYVGGRWWLRREARHKEEVYKLVGSIIEIVSSKSSSPNSFVPMIHVRDQLIPLKDRSRMKRTWEDALELLESDSRLRREVQEVEGEQFMVWRWLASSLTANKKKVWQGQAFDTLEGNLNSHVESPTNCLKIRHMFDSGQEEGDDWMATVVDAVLEKCGPAKILHLRVDPQSAEGLVYIKCATHADAGVAYRALHGSWFASNLITVKYIREHRYHERFPDSVNCSQPLRPSTDRLRSLK